VFFAIPGRTGQQIADQHIQHVERIILGGHCQLTSKGDQRGNPTLLG
jgi:hypothetical protein